MSGFIYFAQGALGISGVALPLFMRSLNWSVSEITAIASIAAAPWILTIVYGLLSDSCPVLGFRRKPGLIVFSILAAVGWVKVASLPTEKTASPTPILMPNRGFAATDLITDGL